MKTKNCVVCDTEYVKKASCSLKDWENSKYCSRKCINTNRQPWNKGKKGFGTWNKGLKMSSEYKKQLSERMKNFYLTDDGKLAKKKIKLARSKQVFTKESYLKGALKRSGDNNSSKRPEVREKIRQARLGSKSHLWKGGKTSENYRMRRSAEYKNWRKSVFTRDDYTCQNCGQIGGRLQAHHLKPWSLFPESRLNLDNGQTLCVPCHMQTDSYAINLKS